MISEIHHQTGYPVSEIAAILNTLGKVAGDILSSHHNHIEIRLFPGLKASARYMPPERSRSNLNIADQDFILSLNASFSHHFKLEVRHRHLQ